MARARGGWSHCTHIQEAERGATVFTSLFPGHAARDADLWNGAAHTTVCLPIPVNPTCMSLTDAPRRLFLW